MNEAVEFRRTSTKDQHPELQARDNKEFCDRQGLKLIQTFEEQTSAYKKGVKRPEWDKCVEFAKEHKCNIVLWRYDRAFRNREEFYKFMRVMFEVYGIKVYSVKEPSIMALWEMIDRQNIQDPIQAELIKGIMKVLWNFLIQQSGEQAEEESRKKSERTKLAVVRTEGEPTKSYKGNVWGRRNVANETTTKEILKLHSEGLTCREISQRVFYWDKNNNKKYISKSAVHKIIQEHSNNKTIVEPKNNNGSFVGQSINEQK